MTKQRVVITGAPGTGKTSVILQLEKSDYFCFHEIVRDFTKDSKETTAITSNPIVSVEDPLAFNKKILNGRIAQYKEGSNQTNDLLFYDRGIPDVLAYMDFFNQPIAAHFSKACKEYIYNKVFLLPPWKEIYKVDEERFESFDQAQEIHKHLEETYTRFGYQCLTVPLDTVDNRVSFILNHL
ncbi:AAA family ATPase [Aquimarina brevivitae]|uniref:Putative ATPase n=1 Tax=Aquimarina brevivitae TaxID=323412 RepID=A0A4Q7NWB7_9FLAO|nr:ATP-binding protein [Aquimarina brevivitae]RZS90692.1 putative ATPase [Aquimarina brevivitae]